MKTAPDIPGAVEDHADCHKAKSTSCSMQQGIKRTGAWGFGKPAPFSDPYYPSGSSASDHRDSSFMNSETRSSKGCGAWGHDWSIRYRGVRLPLTHGPRETPIVRRPVASEVPEDLPLERKVETDSFTVYPTASTVSLVGGFDDVPTSDDTIVASVKRFPAPKDSDSDSDTPLHHTTSTKTCSSWTSSRCASASLTSGEALPAAPPNTPSFIQSAQLESYASPRQLVQHVMEDSAYMSRDTTSAGSCVREASQAAQIHPTAGVDWPGGGSRVPRGLPAACAAGVNVKSDGRGLEAGKDPALAIAACHEVPWRMDMAWRYGCRF